MQFFLIFAILIAILAVSFAVQNTMMVTVSFLAWKIDGSLALVLLITFGLGVIVSLLLSVPSAVGRSREIAALKKQLKEKPEYLSPDPDNNTPEA